MVDWMTVKLAEIQKLVQAGLVVVAIAFVGHTWWKTKAFVPTVGALLLSGVVLWGTSNIQWFQDEIGKEMHSIGPAVALQAQPLSNRSR